MHRKKNTLLLQKEVTKPRPCELLSGMDISHIKKIIRTWPAYMKFIESNGICTAKIKDIKELPVVDKTFITSAIHMVPLFKVRSIIPSSGSTGSEFSFGLFGDTDLKNTSTTIDTLLTTLFNTANRKTLLLNALPGAVPIQSSTVSIASVGVRLDTAVSVIKSFGSSYDQIILVGEPLFMKSLIELGVQESIAWKHIPLFIIVGGEWTPESYSNYLETMAGPQRIYSILGMAELGLNYFLETDETLMLRHLLASDSGLLHTLLGDVPFCPMIFSYDENKVYVETVAQPDEPFESIVLTTLNRNRALPLIRYKGGDTGKVLSGARINDVLKSMGYAPLFSTAGSSILAHFGRGKNIASVHPEQVKELMYNCREVASTTTGNFRLCKKENILHLEVQLKEGIYKNAPLESQYCSTFSSLPLHVALYRFEDFPYALDFERKVQYVSEGSDSEWNREKVSLSTAL